MRFGMGVRVGLAMGVCVRVGMGLIMTILARVMPVLVVRILGLGDALEMRLELAVALLPRQWADLQVDISTCHFGLLIAVTHGVQVFLDAGSQGMPQLLVRDLAPAELQLHTHLVALSEEVLGVEDLDVVVVRINANAELQFLHLAGFVVAMRLLLVLFLLILVFAVINDLADWGINIGRDLNKIQTPFPGHTQGLSGGQDSQLCGGLTIHHAYLGGADALVDAGLVHMTALIATIGATIGTLAGTISTRRARIASTGR